MRSIKFRVWDKDSKRMQVCGENVHDSITFINNEAHYYNLQNGCGSWGEDASYVLMQGTGLTDKNGKEIYEGDIFVAPHDFGPGGFHKRKSVVKFHDNKGYQWGNWLVDELEVIGNIYEGELKKI